MTTTSLRRAKANVWGAGTGMPIIGVHASGSPVTLEAWIYDSEGAYIRTASSVVLPADAAGPGLYTLGKQRIIHTPTGPFLVWTEDPGGTIYPATYYLFAWDIAGNVLRSTSLTPTIAGANVRISGPFTPPSETAWIYFFFWYHEVGFSDDFAHLWKAPIGGGGAVPVGLPDLGPAAQRGPAAGFTTTAPACDDLYAYVFGCVNGLAQPFVWRFPLGGGTAARSPATTQSIKPAESQMYPAGSDATYDYYFSAQQFGFGDGQQQRVRRELATDLWTEAGALSSPSSNVTAAHSTINRGGDVSGYFPYEAAAGRVMKLAQPAGDTAAAGNDGADPQITLDQVGGNNPMLAHLCDLEHAWS